MKKGIILPAELLPGLADGTTTKVLVKFREQPSIEWGFDGIARPLNDVLGKQNINKFGAMFREIWHPEEQLSEVHFFKTPFWIGDIMAVRCNYYHAILYHEHHYFAGGESQVDQSSYATKVEDILFKEDEKLSDYIKLPDEYKGKETDRILSDLFTAFGGHFEKRSSVQMPLWSCRIHRKVTGVKVVREANSYFWQYELEPEAM